MSLQGTERNHSTKFTQHTINNKFQGINQIKQKNQMPLKYTSFSVFNEILSTSRKFWGHREILELSRGHTRGA